MKKAHKHEVGGSGAGDHPLRFSTEEASILSKNNIRVSPRWKLLHGWRISAGGLAVPPHSTGGVMAPVLIYRSPTSWEPQEEGMMSTAAVFP
jgi:hypothetical protein